MPTQEERLTALEKAITELNTNSTVLLGLASAHEIDIRRVSVQITELRSELTTFTATVEERFNLMDARLDNVVGQLALILAKLDEEKK